MEPESEGAFRQTFSFDNGTGRLVMEWFERVPVFDTARRFSCVFLSTSTKDAISLNHHLSAAGIRAYHAGDAREAEVLLAITSARILLIDIDRTFEPWLAILQTLDESHPDVPKVVLTARKTAARAFSRFALAVVPKPAHLGDLLGAVEYAHMVERELNDPERARERERRVLAAIRAAAAAQASKPLFPKSGKTLVSLWCSIRAGLSAMMNKATHVWRKSGCHRARKQHSHA
ncbi:MAG: response regulator [Candidatus Solibacter sp.]